MKEVTIATKSNMALLIMVKLSMFVTDIISLESSVRASPLLKVFAYITHRQVATVVLARHDLSIGTGRAHGYEVAALAFANLYAFGKDIA